MLSTRDNFMLMMRGKIPEYVPRYNIFWGLRPSCFAERRNPDGSGFDMWGVEWSTEGSAITGALPKPGVFILDDIRKWRDVIKRPDFSHVDWELMAKRDLEGRDPDIPLGGGASGSGYFQSLMAFMGFTNGLVACFEEPDEVKALMAFLLDIYTENCKKFIQYYKPDYGSLGDDIAHERNPFVSLPMFRDLFAPSWRAFAGIYHENDLPAIHHNCGHFEEFIDDVVDMGFVAWDPCQISNDAPAIKAKHGIKLALCGWFSGAQFAASYDVTEEEIRAEVKRVMDALAPGGGYAFQGIVSGTDPVSVERSGWINDEYDKLKVTYYK